MSFWGKFFGSKKEQDELSEPSPLPRPAPLSQSPNAAGFYPPGTLIAGRYEVASRPLEGGMGIVYLCFDHDEQRPVALKTFKPKFLPDRAARDLFLREGTTWVELGSHPHIVHAYRVVRIGDGQEVYLVLELIAKAEGRSDASLRSWLVPGKPLPTEQALLFALQIARGMAHATAVVPGLVHRDLKPENVLVGADRLRDGWGVGANRLRITDFGLAQVLQETGGEWATDEPDRTASARHSMRAAGFAGGTPEYAAPEQWGERVIDFRADIYALGCILTEMLTGRIPVQASPRLACGRLHQAGQALQAAQGLPQPIVVALAGCLAVEPGARYGKWAHVEAALGSAYTAATGRQVPTPEAAAALQREERISAGWSYNAIGGSYLDLGRAEIALTYFERVLEVGKAEGEQKLEAVGLNHQGIANKNLGNPQQAIECYEKALALYREMGDQHGEGTALANLGEAHRVLGNMQQAIKFDDQSLETARRSGDQLQAGKALGNLGAAYLQLGDTQRSIELLEERLEIARIMGDRRGEGKALGNLGGAYLQLEHPQRAIQFLEQQLATTQEIGDRRGEGAALNNLGTAYRKLGNTRRAIKLYEQALAIAREVGDQQATSSALTNLGYMYGESDDTRHALSCLEKSLAIAHKMGDLEGIASASYAMALVYAKGKEWTQAKPLLQQAIKISEQTGIPLPKQTQDLLNAIQQFVRGPVDELIDTGLSLIDSGNIKEGLDHLERALALDPENIDGLNLASEALSQVGEAAHALKYCEMVLAIDPSNSVAMSCKGITLAQLNQPAEALLCFEHLLKAEPNKAENYANKGVVLCDYLGQPTQALACFDRAIELDPDLENAWISRGIALERLDRYDEALASFRHVLTINPSSTVALSHIGSLLHGELGRSAEASPVFEQALESAHQTGDPREFEILLQMGHTYKDTGNAERAVGCYDQALAIARRTGDLDDEGAALDALGNAYERLGNLRRAIECHERSLALARETGNRSGQGDTLGNLGVDYAALGDLSRAIECYQESLMIARETSNKSGVGNALANLGTVHLQMGNTQLAREYFEQALAIHRAIGDVMSVAIDSFNMAGLCVHGSLELEQALTFAQQAVQAFTQVGHAEYTQQAQQLVAQLQNAASDFNPAQEAFDALQCAGSVDEMRATVAQFPFMTSPAFIATVVRVISEQVPPHAKAKFEKRLAWLRQIAE